MRNNGGVAWSPILGQGNFHQASRFGRVTWAGGTASAAAPSDGGSGPVVPGDGGGTRAMRMMHPPVTVHVQPQGSAP